MIRKLALVTLALALVLLSARGVVGKHRLGGDTTRLVYKSTRMLVDDRAFPAPVPAPAPAAALVAVPAPSLPAEFLPFQEVDVHAKIAGYVEAIAVDTGDRVAPGQLLATLEVPERVEEVQSAEAGRRRAELEIVRAKAELERQEAAHGA